MASAMTVAAKLKKKHVRVKHQKVKLFRANEPLLSVFMWGVNHSINELLHVNIPVMLMPDDFRAHSKVRVDNHLFNKENLPSHFKVKEYCPIVFRNLRERFGIDDHDFRESLTRSQPVKVDSPGRSNARFFSTSDKMYIMKTLTSEEVEQMHALLKEYHPFIVERRGKTLLPQYLGMHRLTVDSIETYFCIMRNVFSTHLTIHKKYDLKGSTVDREASNKELVKNLPTYKDNNFVKDGTKIHIGEQAKHSLMETLTADVEFLTRMHLMDYSLLLGVHDITRGSTEVDPTLLFDSEDELQQDNPLDEEEDDDEDEDDEDEDEASLVPTPPDSPNTGAAAAGERRRVTRERGGSSDSCYMGGMTDPDVEIYAIESNTSAPQPEVYFMALIDVLTHYGVKKQAAKAAKTVKYGSSADGISTVEPELYAKRFLEFMNQAIV